MRADVVASTERALRILLRYCELCASDNAPEPPLTMPLYLDQGKVPFVTPSLVEGSALPGALVARSLQDRDFEPLHKGDPLWERFDGTVVPYDGSCGDPTYPVFVNEAAYYYLQSGRGIGMTSLVDWPVPRDECSVDGSADCSPVVLSGRRPRLGGITGAGGSEH